MNRGITVLICVFFAVSAVGAVDSDFAPGTIEKQGYDFGAAIYENAADLSGNHFQTGKLEAVSMRINPEIPSQMIMVGPLIDLNENMTEENIEKICRAYLESAGLIDSRFGLRTVKKSLVLNKIWSVVFQKTIDGAPVLDDGIKMAVGPRGKVNIVMGNFGQAPEGHMNFSLSESAVSAIAIGGLSGSVQKAEVRGRAVMPLYFSRRTEYHPVYRVDVVMAEPYSEWYVYVDAENGTILQRVSSVYYDVVSGNVSGSIQPLTPFDPWEDRDFYHLNVVFGIYGPALTDMNGDYTITIPNSDPLDVETWLMGPFMNINNALGQDAYVVENIIPSGTYDVYWNDSNSHPAERDAWYSGVYIHNWIKTLDPNLIEMDYPMNSNVNVNGTCNAFWSGQNMSMSFYREGGGCPNIAQIADVVYHEYGHGISDLQYRPYAMNGAMHEGFSDYIACTNTDQPHVGLGFNGPGTYLRNLDNDNRYPDDWTGEPHHDGLIIGGALWHTRQILSDYPMGYTDTLWHFAKELFPTNYEEYFWAFLTVDDDDGNINNGTPNAGTIFYTFGDLHGIGPGSTIIISADSLYDTEDTLNAYEVNAEIMSPFSPLPDSVLLYYDVGGGWIPVNMTMVSGVWTGEIPPQSHGTYVNYYVYAVDEAGFRGYAPPDAPDEYYTFYVGPDLIPPTITFIEGPPNTVNLFGPYGPFVISAWDVNGIDPNGVYLHYFVNNGSEDEAMMSPTGNQGEFELSSLDLGYRLNSGDTVHYYFTVLDGAGSPNSARYPETGALDLLMAQAEVFEDFEEDGIDNWNVEGAWSLFSPGHNGGYSMIFGPNYPDTADDLAYMDHGHDLSPYASAFITLYHKNVILEGDTCFVLISNDGGSSWMTVGHITGFSGSSFVYGEYDISAALSIFHHDYRVGFRFVSDPDGSSIGVILDDIGWLVGEMTGIEDSDPRLPDRLTLSQNYPNPFNPQTTMSFGLPQKSTVALDIYDLLGRKVTRLVDGDMEAGQHVITWNGKDSNGNSVSSGIYFYRLITDYGVKQAKMTLLK
ncbi:MAG: T9SS type A sorting domain-containing protein [Candidatus Zixiibacteriota bacterium]|nr:MAG: T9SS type A sorting domain-containing protein [candidate division Zixibacteria bacterium]